MPWMESTRMELREEFVLLASEPCSNIKLLCERYGISRKTGYKWLKRYRLSGLEGLLDCSRAPHSSPIKTSPLTEDLIISTRKKFPSWGGRKLKKYLENQGHLNIPSCSVISKILSRNGYIDKQESLKHTGFKRFEHLAPNHLWQMDFKGHFAMDSGRCHPLTILDDHSRFSICLKACPDEKGETVHNALEKVFEQYGLPDRINVDNGSPWGCQGRKGAFTSFAVWLIETGVKLSYSRPCHPQTNGKDERFHRTLKNDLIQRNYFKQLQHAQDLFDQYRKQYNNIRPHEAIDMQTPVTRYKQSYKKYSRENKKPEYDNHMLIRKADIDGRIHLQGMRFKVGKAFAYKHIALKQESDNTFNCFYFNTKIKNIDLKST